MTQQIVRTIDAHTEGEPLRIIVDGWPEIPGDSILAKRAYAREHHEVFRRGLMFEPRGHADMYGAILVPAPTDDGDIGVLFIHNEGYSTMCGHGIIAMTKIGLEHQLYKTASRDVVRIDSPAGRITAYPQWEGDTVRSVTFENVPSFILHDRVSVDVPSMGAVEVTVAYGGAFYAYVDADPLGLTLDTDHARSLIDAGMAIKHAVMDALPIRHPSGGEGLNFLYGTIFVSQTQAPNAHSRNVCIFADGEVDRSPTGTGVSGRIAIHHARGEVPDGEWIRIESILGSSFEVRAASTTTEGEFAAVVPEVRGRAFLTGRHEFVLDDEDPLAAGFFIR